MAAPSTTRTLPDPALTPPQLQAQAERALVAKAKASLLENGWTPERHGVVVHDAPPAALLGYCLVWGAAALLGVRFPLFCLVLVLLASMSALADLDGARGWVRGLVPRRASLNLLATHNPASNDQRLDLVLAVGAHPHRNMAALWLALLPAVGGLWTAAGLLGRAIAPETGLWMLLTSALAAGISAVLTLGMVGLTRPKAPDEQALEAIRLLAQQATGLGPRPPRIGLVLTGGAPPHGDGLEVLLRNNPARMVPGETQVVHWTPAKGALHAVAPEGLVRRRAIPACFQDPGADLPKRRGNSPASIAQRLGFQALGLRGGDPAAAASVLMRIARSAPVRG